MKNNFEFIKDRLEGENITAPNTISEESIMEQIENGAKPKANIKLRNNKAFKATVSLVACFAILIVSLTSINAYSNKARVEENVDNNVSSSVITYKNYGEIEKQIKKLQKDDFSIFNYGIKGNVDLLVDEEATTDVVDDSSASHSETNIQVEGVDEADIIKTDGEYIYTINANNSGIKIFKVNGEEAENISSVKIENDHDYIHASDLYLYNNKLVAVSWYENYDDESAYCTNSTAITVFNIENKKNPTVEYSYEQSGYYSNSRMIGGIVYLVSNYNVVNDNYIPYCNGKKIDCDCIYGVENIEEPNYIVVGAVDVDSHNKNSVKSKAILGGASNIYCSNENLYVLCTNYGWYDGVNKNKNTTDILKISLDKTKLELIATSKINGYINNQYSVNEREGKLFVAATTETSKFDDINTLYVLDEKLNAISKVDSFAKNESIKAVRYVGNYAYVITYEQTDPLFIIDLSDIHNPQIKGSVKIDGFSTSLFPVDENTILGVGNNVDDLMQDGTKFVLFDVSNPEKPEVLDELEYVGYYSPAQYDIKAITLFDNKLAIPFDNSEECGILILDYNEKLTEINRFESKAMLSRVVQIDSYLYGLTDEFANIEAFKM